MASAKQYRQFRDECLRWAQAARNEAERDIYLQLAKTWHEAELRLEQSLALIAESNDRAPLFNPATEQQIGEVRLGDADDVDLAVAAAKCR